MTARPQLLLLPGLVCDAEVFAPQVAALSGIAEITVPDFRGFDSLADMARASLAMVAGPVSILGYSMGGRVALECVRLAPERIERLCLLDTGAHPRREGEEEQRGALVGIADREGMAALAAAWLPPMLHPDRRGDAALVGRITAMIGRSTPQSHAGQIRALLERPDARPLLAQIRCPTLVMTGRQDAWASVAQHEEMARQIKGSTLVIIEDSGHFTLLEQPQAVNAALADWLARPARERAAETGMERA